MIDISGENNVEYVANVATVVVGVATIEGSEENDMAERAEVGTTGIMENTAELKFLWLKMLLRGL